MSRESNLYLWIFLPGVVDVSLVKATCAQREQLGPKEGHLCVPGKGHLDQGRATCAQ